jgi:hypothetical protein
MRWLLPIIAAACLAASLALPRALSGIASPAQGRAVANQRSCATKPDWFIPIHHYYDCNPRITPQFDFASLYAPSRRKR